MKVIAEIEYEVDDSLTLSQALKAIRKVPHGSIPWSTDINDIAKFKKVLIVKKEIKE